jgi:hypothetical protein
MSTQPVSISQPTTQAEDAKIQRQRAERRSDALYIAGGVLISAGLGFVRFYLAPIALGIFCLVFPALELITGFIRVLRAPHNPQRR